jgi:hypothetical protein
MTRGIVMRSILLVAAACGARAPATSSITNADPGAHDRRPPCPRGKALEQLARSLWEPDKGSQMMKLGCVEIWRGERAYWWIDGELRKDPPVAFGDLMWAMVVAVDDHTVAWGSYVGSTMADRRRLAARADDFDGDGNDDVWWLEIMDDGFTFLHVTALGMLPPTGDRVFIGNRQCVGEWKLIHDGRERLLDITRRGVCDPVQTPHERYRLHEGKFVEVAVAERG